MKNKKPDGPIMNAIYMVVGVLGICYGIYCLVIGG